MVRKNSLRIIKYGGKSGFASENMFKWLIVLYVDPQFLMTNRRKLPTGQVPVSREKECRHEGINNTITYIVSP